MSTVGDEMQLEVNAKTGKLRPVWASGDVAFDDKMVETVMSLLVEDVGPFTKNRRVGPGPLSVGVDSGSAPSTIKARAEERLQLAIDDGRLKSAVVTVERQAPGRFAIGVEYVTRTGQKNTLSVPIG